MGKRTDALMRIFHADNAVDQYGAELRRLIGENIHRQNQAAVIALAEQKFKKFKSEQTQLELNEIVEKYGDAKPQSLPSHSAFYRFGNGWSDGEKGLSGLVKAAPDPRNVAHSLTDPKQASERKKGNHFLLDEMRGVLGQLQDEAADNARKLKIATALISALEAEQSEPLQRTEFTKLSPRAAGVLPSRNTNPKYEGRWLPESPREKELAASLYPDYKKFLDAPDRINATELPEDVSMWYAARDPLKERHDRIIQEYLHREAAGDPQLKWQIVTPDVSQAVEQADEFLGLGKVG
jgi:hypothetical protein